MRGRPIGCVLVVDNGGHGTVEPPNRLYLTRPVAERCRSDLAALLRFRISTDTGRWRRA